MAADQGGPNWGGNAAFSRSDFPSSRARTSNDTAAAAPSSQIAAGAVAAVASPSPQATSPSGSTAPSLPGIDYIDQFLPDNFFESARRRNAPGPFAVPSLRPETSAWRSTSSSPSSERTEILMTDGSKVMRAPAAWRPDTFLAAAHPQYGSSSPKWLDGQRSNKRPSPPRRVSDLYAPGASYRRHPEEYQPAEHQSQVLAGSGVLAGAPAYADGDGDEIIHRRMRSASQSSAVPNLPKARHHPYPKRVQSAQSSPMTLAPFPSSMTASAPSDSLPSPLERMRLEAPPLSTGSSPSTSSAGQKRRGKLPKEVTETLRTWLLDHVAHPYPTEDEKRQLCERTNLNMSQVSNWFINARRRILTPLDPGATPTTSTEGVGSW